VADVNVSEREYVSRVSFYDRQALDKRLISVLLQKKMPAKKKMMN
jgi:hypothetical protein